jgi:cobalamin biosynthesis protein CobD/CbiB
MSNISNWGFVKYLEKLIDSKHSDDSKVFVGLLAFVYVLITGFVNLFTAKTPAEFVFFGILGLVISVFGLTTYIKQKSMGIKGDIASDIVKEDPKKESTDSAQSVLESDKPS